MPNFQNDYDGFIKTDGCLCFDLVRMAEVKVNKGLTHLQLADLIYVLHWKVLTVYDKQRPVLSDEGDITKPGIYVWDHDTVVNQALLFMNILDLKCQYIGRQYMPDQEARGKKSFGVYTGADEILLGVQTTNGGHFIYPPLYDPWKSGTRIVGIKSARYYKWLKI